MFWCMLYVHCIVFRNCFRKALEVGEFVFGNNINLQKAKEFNKSCGSKNQIAEIEFEQSRLKSEQNNP